MSEQENLFAAPKRPLRLRLSVTREWERSETATSVQASVWATGTSEPLWIAHSIWDGPQAGPVSRAVAEAHLAMFSGDRWRAQPVDLTQAEWERHLFGP